MAIYGGPDIVTDGLVLHLDAANSKSYPGSGTSWFDLSGNNVAATLTNGPSYSATNKGIIALDGINDFVNISSGIPLRTNTFTNEIMAYPTNLTGGQAGYSCLIRMVCLRSDNSFTDLQFSLISNGSIRFDIKNTADTGYDSYTTNSGIVSINNWYHIVQVIDRANTTIRCYLNNALVINITNSSSYSIITQDNIVIGQLGTDVNNTFARRLTGRVGLVRLYGTALSASQVSQNYNALKGRYGL